MAAAQNTMPLAVGVVISAIIAHQLMARLGRTLILIGLLVTLAGVAILGVMVVALGTGINLWLLIVPVLILELGMGLCFGTIFDVALGDIAHDETGSASGALNAVQQISNTVGSAGMTSIFFGFLVHHGQGSSVDRSLVIVGGVIVVSMALVWLLPERAPADNSADAAETHSRVEAAPAL